MNARIGSHVRVADGFVAEHLRDVAHACRIDRAGVGFAVGEILEELQDVAGVEFFDSGIFGPGVAGVVVERPGVQRGASRSRGGIPYALRKRHIRIVARGAGIGQHVVEVAQHLAERALAAVPGTPACDVGAAQGGVIVIARHVETLGFVANKNLIFQLNKYLRIQ